MHRAANDSVGRELVWRLYGCWFGYIHWWSHRVVSLSEIFISGLVLIQPMKTRPDMTENILTGSLGNRESNRTKLMYISIRKIEYITCI